MKAVVLLERRPRFVHGRGDRQGAALLAVRADDSTTASATRAKSKRRAPSRARSASSGISSSTSICAPSADRRSPPTTPCRATGICGSTDIPSTYVPARNTIFLSLALGWAEVLGAHDIVIGVNALDYSGYPDCRPEFIAAFESLAAAGDAGRRRRRALPRPHAAHHADQGATSSGAASQLGLDYGLTHSCYDPSPDGRPCGRCDSCVLRAKGFAEAGRPRSPGPALESRLVLANSQRQPIRRQVVAATCRPADPARRSRAVVGEPDQARARSRARRTGRHRRSDSRRIPQSVSGGLDSIASALRVHPAVDGAQPGRMRSAVRRRAAGAAAAAQHRPHRHGRRSQRVGARLRRGRGSQAVTCRTSSRSSIREAGGQRSDDGPDYRASRRS